MFNGQKEIQILGSAPNLHHVIRDDIVMADKKTLVMFVLENNVNIVNLYINRLHDAFDFYKLNCDVKIEEMKAEKGIYFVALL